MTENQSESTDPTAAVSTEEQRRQWVEMALRRAAEQAAAEHALRRERIATAVLSGLLAGVDVRITRTMDGLHYAPDADQTAAVAIAYADALAARLAMPPEAA